MDVEHGRVEAGRLLKLRRRLSAALVEGFFGGLSRASRLHPKANPAVHDVEVLRDIPYSMDGDPAHRLDVYRPRTRRGPLPACLYLHGGGFRILSKESHWLMGLLFARRGFVCFVPDYRLAPRHPFPAAVEDACSALRWAFTRAEAYGADQRRLVLAGESAGANLACALTVATCYPRDVACAREVFDLGVTPSAVVPLCGVLQASDSARFSRRERLLWLVDDELSSLSDDYLPEFASLNQSQRDLADPLLVFERGERPERPLPPFFASVGGRDPLIDDTRRLEAALASLGVDCEARYYPNEMHAFQALLWSEAARDSWRATFELLTRALDHHWTPPDSSPFTAESGAGRGA